MKNLVPYFKHRAMLALVFLANIFLSFHYFTTVYVNSPYLAASFPFENSTTLITILYIIAAFISIILFLFASTFLTALGNYRFTLILSFFDLLGIFVLSVSNNIALILPLFVVHQAVVPVLLYTLDIFLEHYTKNNEATGSVRGSFLTVTNISLVLSPLLLTLLAISQTNFKEVYQLSLLFLVSFILTITLSLRHFVDLPYHKVSVRGELKRLFSNYNIRNVFLANFLMQLFFSWVVLYIPLYLIQNVGFSFSEFTIMLTIILLPFAVMELPIGILADKKFGEKEMMVLGFFFIGIFLAAVSFIEEKNFFLFTFFLLLTRVGAALVETTTESYFFKKTNEADADLTGLFRMARPLAYVVGPLFGLIVLLLVPLQYSFIIFGLTMALGALAASRIEDTL